MLSLVTPSAAVPFAASMFVNDNASLGVISLVAGIACAFDAYNMQHHLRAKNIFDVATQTKLMHVVHLLDGLREISRTIKRYPLLAEAMPALRTIEQTIAGIAQSSHDAKKLLDLLGTSTFRGSASQLSYNGRVIAAYQLMIEQRDQFVVLMHALGEIDAQMSVARLYKEFADERVHFCFPTYNTADAKPSLTLQQAWNPVLSRTKAVANNAQLGGDATRNIIITGPNAGGKSTYMKSVVLCAICAQSIGIAPAQQMTFTPFGKIRTYLNITDDLAAGHSHFKAGVIRARELLETVQALKDGELCLTVVDEVFNGTTFTEGQAAAYSFLKLIGSFGANVMITSTHFPAICDMAESMGSFTNFRVTVNSKPGEKLSYPYTIEQGVSPQVITLQILEEEGFGPEFLADAQECLNRLAKTD